MSTFDQEEGLESAVFCDTHAHVITIQFAATCEEKNILFLFLNVKSQY